MKKILAVAAILAVGVSMSAQAGLISGEHLLSNGNTVALQGLEWMPLTYTVSMSRNDIEDGFTDRFGGRWNAGEWRYASRVETATLLRSLWDHQSNGWSAANFVGLTWFKTNLALLGYDTGFGGERVDREGTGGHDWSDFAYGDTGECGVGRTCKGHVAVNNDTGWLNRTHGLSGSELNVSALTNSYRLSDFGSLLVRSTSSVPTPVPAPTAISLLGLGLCALTLRRRRKASESTQNH